VSFRRSRSAERACGSAARGDGGQSHRAEQRATARVFVEEDRACCVRQRAGAGSDADRNEVALGEGGLSDSELQRDCNRREDADRVQINVVLVRFAGRCTSGSDGAKVSIAASPNALPPMRAKH